MVRIHKVILPFHRWALITGVASAVCVLFAVVLHEQDSPDEPTTIEEPSE